MHSLHKHILHKWPAFPGHFAYQVALSGGVDSVVLLHCLNSLRAVKQFNLSAIHINHGISPNSNAWEEACRDFCTQINVAITISRHKVGKSGGESLENNARITRYREFAAGSADIMVLAHQQNDQIETVLSQIFRGSSINNIAAMQEISQKKRKIFWRPLLDIPRSAIESYAGEFGLSYISDESNLDNTYLRNFIRNLVMPQLNEFDPHIGNKILNFPLQIQSLLLLVGEIAAEDLKSVSTTSGELDLEQFNHLSFLRRQQVLNRYILQNNLALPSMRQIDEFIRQCQDSNWERSPMLQLGTEHKIVKFKNKIKVD